MMRWGETLASGIVPELHDVLFFLSKSVDTEHVV